MGSAGFGAGAAAGAPPLRVRWLTERPGAEVGGEVALHTRREWEAVLERAVAHDSRDVHLDLSELTFVDAGGAASLARAARRLPPGGRVLLHHPPAALRRVLGLLWPEEQALVVCPR